MDLLYKLMAAWIPLIVSIWFYIFIVRFLSKLIEFQEQQNNLLEESYNEDLKLVMNFKSIAEIIGQKKSHAAGVGRRRLRRSIAQRWTDTYT